jgi:aspartate-semialdehyde dehydrogenase
MSKEYNVAIMGATGAVGEVMLSILEERKFPVKGLKLLASERSAGKEKVYKGNKLKVELLTKDSFKGVDIVLASAGASISKQFLKDILDAKALIIDNSSAFRMDKDVPLVVPEINPEDCRLHKGIIANPNCTTIIAIVPLKPIHDAAKIKRMIVSSYQAASGAGAKAMAELEQQGRDWAAGKPMKAEKFPYQLLWNVIPHIDVFTDNGYTKEEMKVVNETRKIMHAPDMKIAATTVRVPVLRAHSETIIIETEKKLTPDEARKILSKAPGVTVEDDPANKKYPMPLFASGKDNVYVGRIREDISCPGNGLNLFVVGDQIRKGAALNAVQIAEILLKEGLK